VISDRRAKQSSSGATQSAIGAEHQNLRSALVDDCERIALVISGRDNPAGKFNRKVRHILAGWELIGAGRRRCAILGIGCAKARES
jgi:hypothetical protein